MTIDYSSRQVWETRFTKYPDQFEWLASADDLLPHIASLLDLPVKTGDEESAKASNRDSDENRLTRPRGRLLHIGCGTSKLAFALRDALGIPPQDIVNLDYSQVAIDLGRAQEQEQEQEQEPASQSQSLGQSRSKMHWVCADLLDWQSLSTPSSSSSSSSTTTANTTTTTTTTTTASSSPTTNPTTNPNATSTASQAPYTLILDKSTSDALACGHTLTTALAFLPNRPLIELDPLPLLALHLAALTAPGARWLAMSYSATRFDFLTDPLLDVDLGAQIPGVATAQVLWMVERVEEKEAFQQQGSVGDTVHRPPIVNHIYTLRRTDTPLEVWPASEF